MMRIDRSWRARSRGALVGAIVLALSGPLAAQAPVTPSAGDLVLLGGQLFDGISGELRPNTGVVLRNGTIVAVDAGLTRAAAGSASVLEFSATQTILPGLFDLHAHYAVDLYGEGRVDEYTVNPIVFLANGVTSTFPAGEVDPEGMLEARRRIDRGEQIGPRIYNSGPYYGTARPGWDHESMTPDSVAAEVAYWASRGARGFKAKGIREPQLRALIDAAHRHGLTVTAHLDSGFRESVNPRDAILMGIDRIEHFMGGDAITGDRPAYSSLEVLDASRAEVADQARLFRDHGVFFDATITAYGYFGAKDPDVYSGWFDEMTLLTPVARRAAEARLPREVMGQFERIYQVKHRTLKAFYDEVGPDYITLGTDHPSWGEFFSGFGSHREMHAMVRAGIPAADVLRIATINGARALGVSHLLGSIEAGKLADLFVVNGNPLQDITVTHSIAVVIKAGRIYNPAAILDSVVGRLGPASEVNADWWKGSLRFGG